MSVDWLAYFESIKGVCPWARSAALQGRIRIQHWHSTVALLGNDLAVVYLAPKHKPRQLKRITDRLNSTYDEYEFLWSHPSYKGYSTPIAAILQQDAATLENLRNRRYSKVFDK